MGNYVHHYLEGYLRSYPALNGQVLFFFPFFLSSGGWGRSTLSLKERLRYWPHLLQIIWGLTGSSQLGQMTKVGT
jgi:hypothetical protein